jgi:hypothetical protein
MAVKPFKILADLQSNKQIIKLDSAANNAVLFNVSGTLAGGGHVSSSLPYTGSGLYIDGNAVIAGKLTAREYHAEVVSSSIIYQSGSTKFGDSADDLHQFTGSVQISGGFGAHYLTASLGLLSNGPSTLVGTVNAQNGLTITNAPLDASTVAVSASGLNVTNAAVVGSTLAALGGLTSSAGLSVAGTASVVGPIISNTSVLTPLLGATNAGLVTASVATTASFNAIAIVTASQTVNGVSYDMYNVDQAFHAIDSAMADKTATQNAYKRLRYQTSGSFDPSGVQLVALPTSSLGGDSFPVSSIGYITVDVLTKFDINDNWMNDVMAIEVYVTGSPGSEYIEVAINAADVPHEYRLIAVNEDPTKYVV